MHRSGTSLVTKLLGSSGLYLGEQDELLPAVSYNADGLWEHRKFVELNEQVLAALDGAWDSAPAIPKHWDDDRLRALLQQGAELIDAFAGRGPWGWKDPRNSLTLPFWRRLLPELKVVVVLRNPLEVALSLRRRGYPSVRASLDLWMVHNQRILDATSPETRVVTHYDAYFPHADRELRRVADFLGLQVSEDAAGCKAQGTLPHLRHSRFTAKHLLEAGVPARIVNLYLTLCKEAGFSESVGDDCLTPAAEPSGAAMPDDRQATETRTALDLLGRAMEAEALRQEVEQRDGRIAEMQGQLRGQESAALELAALRSAVESQSQQIEAFREEAREAMRAERAAHEARLGPLEQRLCALLERQEADLREHEALRQALADQTSRVVELRAEIQGLHARTLVLEDQIEGALFDLKTAQAIAQASGPNAAKDIAYLQAVSRIHEAVRRSTPRGSTLAVISKGDERLLKFPGRRGWHFPQNAQGVYAGNYPAHSVSAIAHLEAMRMRGAEFLLVPATSVWWLEHYAAFGEHLRRRYQEIEKTDDGSRIFDLREIIVPPETARSAGLEEVLDECHNRLGHGPAVLDWTGGRNLAKTLTRHTVFSPPAAGPALPYLEKSVDVVVCDPDPAMLAEARRVAKAAVATLAPANASEKPSFHMEWQLDGQAAALPTASIILGAAAGARQLSCYLEAVRCSLPRGFRGDVYVAGPAELHDVEAIRQRWREAGIDLVLPPPDGPVPYAASCNRAAKAATGEFLVFLDQLAVPLDGWLTALWQIFAAHPAAGAAGAKVLQGDGLLGAAGGVVFADGSLAGFGSGDYQTADPLYGYVREADYSGDAVLVTPRAVFDELGGFDLSCRTAGYAHADYCLRARERNRRTYYQPESVVAVAASPWGKFSTCQDPQVENRQHRQFENHQDRQVRNLPQDGQVENLPHSPADQPWFCDRWKHVLKGQPFPGHWRDRDTWSALAVRRAVNGEVER
jgi:hypothetical protein